MCSRTIQAHGQCSLALSGGSTPRPTYTLLAQPSYAVRLDWSRVHVFWGDERLVPPDHPESNFRLAWEALLCHVPIPAENIHRIAAELPPQQAADRYEQELRRFFSRSADPQSPDPHRFQTFDLLLLGLGMDGHIASLFPASSALYERERWVVAVEHSAPPPPLVPRVTLTIPAINAASHVAVLVAGEEKADCLKQVLSPAESAPLLPAQMLRPTPGVLTWLVDQAAASRLDH